MNAELQARYKVATGTIFNVFCMLWPGIEPTTPAPKADALTITLLGPVLIMTL